MRLPPEPVLVAAKRWLELLPTSGGIPRAQTLLTTHTQYSDLTPTQYATALTLLRDLELLENVDSPVPAASRLFGAIFEKAPPPWVQDADLLVQSPDELPSDITSAGETLGLGSDGMYAQLVGSWGKVDTSARERVGAAGEAALVALLTAIPGGEVDHVALSSDGYGYDIAFTRNGEEAHLEVKSTSRRSRFTAYLSRHEYGVMVRDESWVLVTVRLGEELDIVAVGCVPKEWIAANVPRDDGTFGSWATVKLEVPEEVVTSGIPQLGGCADGFLPPW
jgi:hypothetical protein